MKLKVGMAVLPTVTSISGKVIKQERDHVTWIIIHVAFIYSLKFKLNHRHHFHMLGHIGIAEVGMMRPNMEVMYIVKSLKFQYICHFCMVILVT